MSVSRLVRLFVSAGLLAFLAFKLDWSPMMSAIANIQVGWALAALGLFLLTPLVASYRWQLLARPLGFRYPLRRFTGIYFLGMYFNLLLPSSVGGDVVRAWYLDGGQNRKMSAFLCVIVDRFTGLLMLIAMACCATLLQLENLPVWVVATVWSAAGAAVGGLVLLPWIARLIERWRPPAEIGATTKRNWRYWLKRMEAIPAGFVDALGQYRGRLRLIAVTCLLSLGIMAANVVFVWMLGEALGGGVALAYYWVAVPVLTLLTLVPISINGMGVREAGLGLLLAQAGAPTSFGVAVAVLLFGLYVAAGLIGAGVYLFGSFPTLAANQELTPAKPEPLPVAKAA